MQPGSPPASPPILVSPEEEKKEKKSLFLLFLLSLFRFPLLSFLKEANLLHLSEQRDQVCVCVGGRLTFVAMTVSEYLFGGVGVLVTLGLAALYLNQKKLIYMSYMPEVPPLLPWVTLLAHPSLVLLAF